MRIAQVMITSTKTQQLDIVATNALRLQREVPATVEESDTIVQTFEKTTSKGYHGTVQTLEKAPYAHTTTTQSENQYSSQTAINHGLNNYEES